MQDIITYTIGLLIVAFMCRKLYRFVFIRKGKVDKCAGCAGCDLKKELEKARNNQCERL